MDGLSGSSSPQIVGSTISAVMLTWSSCLVLALEPPVDVEEPTRWWTKSAAYRVRRFRQVRLGRYESNAHLHPRWVGHSPPTWPSRLARPTYVSTSESTACMAEFAPMTEPTRRVVSNRG